MPGMAQVGNEWINFSQSYYKIPVIKDGIYRLTYSDLQSAGFPVGTAVDPRRIQLYHRGVEQAIFVQGQADAIFNPSDYIEFYGKRNDGTLDAKLYRPASLQPHPYYNLYSDTAAYFLTWTESAVQGKRMTSFSEVNVTSIPQELYHTSETLKVNAEEYSVGNTVSTYVQASAFDQGEGWTGSTICFGNSGCVGQLDYTFDNLLRGVPGGGNPTLALLLVGRDALAHQAEIYVGPNAASLRLVTTKNFLTFETSLVSTSLQWTDIGGDGKMVVRIRALGVGGIRDRLSVSYLKINFPQNFNMNNQAEKIFQLAPKSSGKSYIEISNPGSGARMWDITDENNLIIIGTGTTGGLSAIVPNTTTARTLYVSNGILNTSLKRISFRQIFPAAHNYLIITHRSLMKPAGGYSDAVKAYGGYRASAAGGAYDTLVVTTDQLYNQFNYGETSSLAIYQFAKFMYQGGSPKYLFLIGKGLDIAYGFHRKGVVGTNGLQDLVPTAGTPASDMLYSVGLTGSADVPAIATGRITTSTAAQVAGYLSKVIETESLGFTALWRKDILHLSGGIQPDELINFKTYMDGFKTIAEGDYLGGTVTTITKKEPDPVEFINISDQVNAGVNLITFFGHASPNAVDIDIGFVSNPVLGYNNPGKYPTFLINGCDAGTFFYDYTNFAEDWILTSNKGARGFIAHSSYGFPFTLKIYTDIFYAVGFTDPNFMTRGTGDIQLEVAKRLLQQLGNSMMIVSQAQQMVYLGDPALKLFGASKPDYEINDGALSIQSFTSKPVTALSDSFAIKINVRNFGITNSEKLKVTVTRTLADNTVIAYDSLFNGVATEGELLFTIKNKKGVGGTNRFFVTLDSENNIAELDEANNSGSFNYFLPLNGTKNLYPPSFGIVNQPSIELLWQGTDVLSGDRKFRLELDTVDSFTSPFLKKITVSGKVLATTTLSLLPKDSTAYYWRTVFETPQPGESSAWMTSSFAYIKNSGDGWAQVHFPQFMSNETEGLIKDPQLRELKYLENQTDISIKTFGSNHPVVLADLSFKLNGTEYNFSTVQQQCRNNTINLIAFNKSSAVPYAPIPFILQDPRICGRTPQVINSFLLSEIETTLEDDLIQVVDNVQASDSLVIFSIGDPGFASWSTAVKTKLGELGISDAQLSGIQQGEPVVIFAKKGATPGTAKLFKSSVSPANQQELLVSGTITGRFTSGTMNTNLIGPASAWQDMILHTRDRDPSDVYGVDVYGVNLTGQETLLLPNITHDTNLSTVDAKLYPILKLKLHTVDELALTPIQVHQWLMHYTPVPEGIVFLESDAAQVSVYEGATWTGNFTFRNISNKNFTDSLQVDYDVLNSEQHVTEKKTKKIKPPAAQQTTSFGITVNTAGKGGLNDIGVYVNPQIQPEQYYENNALSLVQHLQVIPDKSGPVLDVTIDGRYVVNNDFVQPNPLILIRMKDDNPFLFKSDTTGINIYLQYPCASGTCDFTRVNFTSPDLTWQKATATSAFMITVKPKNLPTGAYVLKIEARDVSNNASGVVPYEIAFRVSDTTAFELPAPYPNPSAEKFFFDIVVSGEIIPDYVQLVVHAVDGRLVQRAEITANLHVGTNQLVWDARDFSGTPLPPGIYIYQLLMSAGDQQLRKNGKLSLMR
jgi:hypothetical protein